MACYYCNGEDGKHLGGCPLRDPEVMARQLLSHPALDRPLDRPLNCYGGTMPLPLPLPVKVKRSYGSLAVTEEMRRASQQQNRNS